MRVYYDRDADLALIRAKKVAIVGYGSQGHAHALNLRDSGVTDIAVALRPGSATIKKAEAAGLKVITPDEAGDWADVVMILTPDELQAKLYTEHLQGRLRQGAALALPNRNDGDDVSGEAGRQFRSEFATQDTRCRCARRPRCGCRRGRAA